METLLPLLAADIEPLTMEKMPDFGALGVELWLCLMVLVMLVVDLVQGKGGSALYPKLTMGGIAVAFGMVLLGGGGEAVSVGYGGFEALSIDGLSKLFKLVFLATGFLTVFFIERSGEKWGREGELQVLMFGALAGMCYLASATELIGFYLAFEMVSYTAYLMAGYKLDSVKSAEASGKYVIFGSVSSGVMLFGISLIYGFTGSTQFDVIASSLVAAEAQPILMVAGIMTFAGFAYKAAAFPFQFWCPDVYEGAPAPVAGFLAVASKAAAFAVGLRLLSMGTIHEHAGTLSEVFARNASFTQNLLIAASIGTMTWGNLAALRQDNLQRMLAYSSIAHAGYLLMTCVVVGSGESGVVAMSAIVFYFLIYLCMNLGAFFIVTLMRRDIGSAHIEGLRGAGVRHPVLATCFAIMLFSLTGLPPTAGFVGKFLLFMPVIKAQFYVLALVGLLNGAVSLYYYARPLREMFFREAEEGSRTFAIVGVDTWVVAILTVPLIVFGLAGWSSLTEAAQEALAVLP